MEKRKILFIFGTRPETIKLAPLIKGLQNIEEFAVDICVTGQHREMLYQVLTTYNLRPDYDLQIMTAGQTLTDITCKILQGLPMVFADSKPNLVVVHGDTGTAMAAAMAAFYAKLPIIHIEAGLRTWNKYSPYPEEINRQLIGVLADLHCAPTTEAATNLVASGIPASKVIVTGNTVIDAVKLSLTLPVPTNLPVELKQWAKPGRLVLLTAHRRENVMGNLREILLAVAESVNTHADMYVVYPVHLNPKIQALATEIFADNKRVKLIAPMEPISFHHLLANSYLVLTDSGGVQEEAAALHKPVLVLRDTTERGEGLDSGALRLVGTAKEEIKAAITKLWQDSDVYQKMASAVNPFGDGQASAKIIAKLKEFDF